MEQSKSLSSTMHILPCIYDKGHNNFVSQKFSTYTILHNKLSASLALPVVSFQPWWVQMTLPLLSFKIFRYDITDHNQFQLRKLLPPQVLFTPYFTLTSTSSSRTVKLITLSKLTHDFIAHWPYDELVGTFPNCCIIYSAPVPASGWNVSFHHAR